MTSLFRRGQQLTPVEDDVNRGGRAARRRVIQEKSLAVGQNLGVGQMAWIVKGS